MNYKVIVDGKEIEYGALVEKSRFSDKEWSAIYAEIVKQNQPEVFENKKSDTDYTLQDITDMIERCDTLDKLKKELIGYFGLD